MKIAQIRHLLQESFNISNKINIESVMDNILYEEEENIDTWADEVFEKYKKDKDYVSYEEAKALYDKLSNKEKKFVAPRGKYIDSPKLVFRLGEYKNKNLAGFIDVYYFNNDKSKVEKDSSKDGFIIVAVDPEYRHQGIAQKLINKAANKAKEAGFDALTYEVEYKNKPSINFIQNCGCGFKNETKKSVTSQDNNLLFRKHLAKEEDEMTSAILSTAPQGGALHCGDNYAPGDIRAPKLLGKIQKRKKS